MKNKQFAIFSLSILILLALVSFASATATATATITNTGNDSITINSVPSLAITDAKSNSVTITFSSLPVTITAGGSATITATAGTIPSNFGLGTFTKTITLTDTTATLTAKITNDACAYPNINGNLDIDVDSIDVVKGFGDNSEWYPLDEIEAKINVANNGDEDIKNIVVKWELYDQTTQTKIISGEEDDFTLKDGDETDLTVNFTLDKISKLKAGDKYVFYAWATGKDYSIDDSNRNVCISTTNEASGEDSISLNLDNNFVVLDSIAVSNSASCGNQVEVTGKAWNIGEDDQQDVYFKVYNSALGINQKVDLGDIDSLESNDFTFTINVPTDAQEKDYDLNFIVYDDSDDVFENDNGDQSKTSILFTVTGGCSTEAPASITASLESEASAGKELIVKTTITNTDSKTNTFSLGLDQYSSWASLDNIDKTSLTLNAGESQEVVIKLKVNNDALGDQKFNVVVKNGEKVLSQPVSVSIAKPSFDFGGLFSGTNGNSYLYGIIALNVLLVLGIIIVAAKMSKKKKE
jgi:hypothetical protein